MKSITFIAIISLTLIDVCLSWQMLPNPQTIASRARLRSEGASRRAFLINTSPAIILSAAALLPSQSNAASIVPDLTYTTSSTGLQYADVKVGTGPSPSAGTQVSIDYVMSTTGARYGSKIYSTVDAGAPYRWKLGDGSTIPGLEEAVSSMSPGGIRRLIIPAKLAYGAKGSADECVDGKGLGPRPSITEAVGEFQRFKNIYCES